MEAVQHNRNFKGRGAMVQETGLVGRRPHSRNRQWVAGENISRSSTPNHAEGERWERGGHRGGRGTRGTSRGMRRFPNVSLHVKHSQNPNDHGASDSENTGHGGDSDIEDGYGIEEPELETAEEREKFYQELVKAREVERKKAIAEGKMDDPLVPKRLEDAITMVGTCMDMCPRFERYRRERENNLFEWETIPGTKRVDHRRAVKMYERAAGDKTLPSDLRPPHVLKRTLDYLFHDLLPRGGFSATHQFIRDRSRAVRNDFTMQHVTGALAIECHDRCARFHILALHFERNSSGFSIALEEQQLMNTLQSLKEFYEDQRGRYQSPTELEMRVYHRLIHIRDQKERSEDIPPFITSHPVFQLTTDFRLHVQKKSAPIRKNSPLVVDEEAMQIFAQLAGVLREQGNIVMIYLVACILERLFGTETIEDIESIRESMSISDIIDGAARFEEINGDDSMMTDVEDAHQEYEVVHPPDPSIVVPAFPTTFNNSKPSQPPFFGPKPTATPASVGNSFSNLVSSQNIFGTTSVFAPISSTPRSSSQAGSAFPSLSVDAAASSLSPPLPQVVNPRPSITINSSSLSNQVETHNKEEDDIRSVTLTNRDLSETDQPSTTFGSGSPLPASRAATEEIASTSMLFVPTPPVLNPAAPAFVAPTVPPVKSVSMSSDLSTIPSHNGLTDTPVNITTEPSHPRPRLSVSTTRRPSIVLPKIVTTTNIDVTNGTISPAQPPPLAKKQPISLPATPTTTPPPQALHLSHIKSGFNGFNNDVLSPLPLASPSGLGLVHNFSPFSSPSKQTIENKLLRRASILNGKGKAKELEPNPQPSNGELKAKATTFYQKCITKKYYELWKKRAMDYAAWLEACRHSDTYRQKVQHQRTARVQILERKRTPLEATLTDTSPKKRIKRRISNDYQPPRTDEELAQRLKEVQILPLKSVALIGSMNYEEHARRWAPGSFLQILKLHLQGKVNVIPASWQVWLSTNPDSDATAIWLERKFDIPNSGHWISENIFSIPLAHCHGASKVDFPGIIVFECTPVQNVGDDIERKYHILDDCARLRDIINAFPGRRHYIPSLFVVRWADQQEPPQTSDFSDMIQKLVSNSVIGDAYVFSITSEAKNLDVKFKEALSCLQLDLSGKLVYLLTINGLYTHFEPLLESFFSEWLENCFVSGEFDWTIYGEVAQATIKLLNDLATIVAPLLALDVPNRLPRFDSTFVDYSDAAYESAFAWFSDVGHDEFFEGILQDLQSHHEIGQEFPARSFLNYIVKTSAHLTQTRAGGSSGAKHIVFRAELKASLEAFETLIKSSQTELSHILNKHMRRSPKRRGPSEETDRSSCFGVKRRRLSASVDLSILGDAETLPPSPQLNGQTSPSPSVSTISLTHGDQPRITVAMLRALTKDLKQKYTGTS
ncbi:hypothetical protein AMATHDRAFT_1283 [Amanita thiersii Skay4041]|uniref:SAC3/GANP/THP3 conserved domain-containing protein n=1 Tax=Amanita thiersii Skay4041 TaxID=703135 RepID=A0A2A9NYQ5_9AGAR|nr:hypothetical protein AMATHDRAFT_1283 [Amanita thiersii Skay4041]